MSVKTTGQTTIEVNPSWQQRTTLNDGTNVIDNGSFDAKISLAYGTATDMADTFWHDQRTVAASGVDSLDLTNLTRQIFNNEVSSNFARVKLIYIDLLNAAVGDFLYLDSSATNAYTGPFNGSATSQLVIGPGDTDGPTVLSRLRDGFGLTTPSNKMLAVKNGSSTEALTYNVFIAGTSS